MKMIQLTQGKTTIVDDDDFERFNKLSWHYAHGRAVRRFGKHTRDKHNIRGTVWLHREIMGNPEGLNVDHINGNPLDNRKSNLRLATQSQNMANARKTTKRKTSSQFKGVYHSHNPAFKNPWQAYIGSARGGNRKNLGSYSTEIEAAEAYNRAAIERFGEFAQLNKTGRALN